MKLSNFFADQIPFGKHRGTLLTDLAASDPGYLNWCVKMANREPDSFVGSWANDNMGSIEDAFRAASATKAASRTGTYELSPSQEAASTAIKEQLLGDDSNHVMRLQGGAGYGKSFATMDVVLAAMRSGYKVRACATSYVATQVLRQQLDDLGVETSTIASLLKLTPNYEGAKETYEWSADTIPEAQEALQPMCLLIVDEYSMVEDTIAQLLIDSANQQGGKLLVVGDAYQLPSPAQSTDSILDKVEPSTELTEPMRYSTDSILYQVERTARHNPYGLNVTDFVDGREVYAYGDWDSFLAAFIARYTSNPSADIRMLWYKRQNVIDANHAIREALFGANPKLIEDGEQVRVQRTGDLPLPQSMQTEHRQTQRYYSGTHYRILKTRDAIEHIEGFDIPVTKATLSNDHEVNLLFSVTENQADPKCRGGAEFNQALRELTEAAQDPTNMINWKNYRNMRNSFLQVAYSYATTVHRTQGMSADIIFTSPSALKQAKPYVAKKLLYVGLTRAKKELHLFGE